MTALEAAQAEGGDIRGRQSAAMIVVSGKPSGRQWKDPRLPAAGLLPDDPANLTRLICS